jgi:hypothetical protein
MRKIVDARDARACVKAARAAGLSLGGWARRHGVDGRSLHAWSVNLGLSLSPRPGPIKRRTVRGPEVSASARARVGDTVIAVGDDFHDETLARVVRVLRAC